MARAILSCFFSYLFWNFFGGEEPSFQFPVEDRELEPEVESEDRGAPVKNIYLEFWILFTATAVAHLTIWALKG